MIRLRLTELLADSSFRQGRRVEWREVAEATGIHRTTLSKMANTRGYNATLSNLDLLCRYFRCQVGDLAVYVPDEELEGQQHEVKLKGPTSSAVQGTAPKKRVGK
jgi:putative transcriptional regulator